MIRLAWLLILSSLCAAVAGANPVLHWTPANYRLTWSDQLTVSVMLDEPLPVRSIELRISYDPTVVTSLSGGPGALFSGYNLFPGFEEVNTQSPGQWHGYCVILGAGDWTTGPGELYRWTLRGDGYGVCDVTTDVLILLPPGGGDYPDAELTDTRVFVGNLGDIAPAWPVGIPALTLQPNPFNPLTHVDIRYEGGGQLDVFDARGRRVAHLWQGEFSAGPRGVDWDGRDLMGRALPSGIYTFLLTGNDGRHASVRGTLLR